MGYLPQTMEYDTYLFRTIIKTKAPFLASVRRPLNKVKIRPDPKVELCDGFGLDNRAFSRAPPEEVFLSSRYILMTPGPVPVPPAVLDILAQPMEHHRTPEFEAVFLRTLERLKSVFETTERVYLHTSTGSGGMESALVNTLSPGDEVLAIVSGKFGERWADMAEAFGAQVTRLNVEWGQAVNPDQVAATLAARPSTKLVLCQACETSTGVLHPVRELAAVIAPTEALFLVDGITALGAMPLPMDEWQLDVVVGGSQKAFMLPTGLSFISFSKKAWRRVETAKCPRFYFDIRSERAANERGETLFSSNVLLIKALDVVLDHVAQEGGMTSIHKRIANLASATVAACEELNLSPYPARPSPSLSAISLPADVDGQKLRSHMEKQDGIVVMGGQDKLKGKIIRIGHMGYITDDDMVKTIGSLAHGLNKFKQNLFSEPQIAKARKACEARLRS